MDNITESPLLKPFPSWSAHSYEPKELISPFRIRADRCGRLWVIDSGIVNILNDEDRTVIRNPSLAIYDLHNDNLLRRHEFPSQQVKNDSLFANVAIEDNDCDNTFAYVTDIFNPALIVYSWKTEESWRITHHYFHPDPLAGGILSPTTKPTNEMQGTANILNSSIAFTLIMLVTTVFI